MLRDDYPTSSRHDREASGTFICTKEQQDGRYRRLLAIHAGHAMKAHCLEMEATGELGETGNLP